MKHKHKAPGHAKGFKKYLKPGAIVLGLVVLILAAGLLVMAWAYNYQARHSADQTLFIHGTLPQPVLNGFYKGDRPNSSWQGKIFNSSAQAGVNQFIDGERYSFKTYTAKSLTDKNLKVLRIDYNQRGNPWWLHFVTDEVVQVHPGQYLGKADVHIIPGMPFTVTYFQLSNN